MVIKSLLLITISLVYGICLSSVCGQSYTDDSIDIDEIQQELIDSIESKEKNTIDQLIKEKIPNFHVLTKPRALILPRKGVKVFIVDSLVGYTLSHGYLVEKILRKYSDRGMDIQLYNIETNDKIDRESRLSALVDILKFSEENQDIGVVVNLSFGCPIPSKAEHELFRQLKYRGVIIVASAGNNDSQHKFYPAGYENEVIAVSAVTNRHKESYSNYGKHIDISAPGGGKVDVQRQKDFSGDLIREYATYHIEAGTSFSAPRVAGIMSLLMAKRPELHPDYIFEIIKNTSSPLKDDQYYINGNLGAGRLDWHKATWNLYPSYRIWILSGIICGIIFIFSLISCLFIPIINKGFFLVFLPIIAIIIYVGLFYFDLRPALGFLLSLKITVFIIFTASIIIILQPIIGFMGLQMIKKGSLYIDTGKYEKAFTNFNKALNIYPSNYKAEIGRDISLCLLGRYNKVIRYYDDGIRIGFILEQKNFNEQALECYNRAISMKPDSIDAWGYKGNLLRKLGRLSEARRCFDQIEFIRLNRQSI